MSYFGQVRSLTMATLLMIASST